MKKFFILLTVICFSSILSAEKMSYVKMIAGDAWFIFSNREWLELKVSQTVKPESIIRIGAGSQVILVSGSSNITLNGPVIVKVGDIITKVNLVQNDSSIQSLFSKITGGLSRKAPTTAAAVRGDNKSMKNRPLWADPYDANQETSCYEEVPGLIDKGKLEKALENLEKPEEGCRVLRQFYSGVILFQKGDFNKAGPYLKRAYRSGKLDDDKWNRALMQHSIILYYQNKSAAAARLLEKYPESFGKERKKAYQLLEFFHRKAGNLKKAEYYTRKLKNNK